MDRPFPKGACTDPAVQPVDVAALVVMAAIPAAVGTRVAVAGRSLDHTQPTCRPNEL